MSLEIFQFLTLPLRMLKALKRTYGFAMANQASFNVFPVRCGKQEPEQVSEEYLLKL